jgi:hypothetical protein
VPLGQSPVHALLGGGGAPGRAIGVAMETGSSYSAVAVSPWMDAMAFASVYSSKFTTRGCEKVAAVAVLRPERASVRISSMRYPSSLTSMVAAVRQGPACSMLAEEGMGFSMMAPARGSSR